VPLSQSILPWPWPRSFCFAVFALINVVCYSLLLLCVLAGVLFVVLVEEKHRAVLSVTIQHTVEPVDLCLDRLCKIIGIYHIGFTTLWALSDVLYHLALDALYENTNKSETVRRIFARLRANISTFTYIPDNRIFT